MFWHIFRIAALALALMLSAAQPAGAQANPWHEGTVVSAAGNRLELTGSRGVRRVDRLTPMTVILINGQPARLSALRPGERVKVFLDELGNVAVVENTATSP